MEGEQAVLVTGGSGFLGGWCVVAALKDGYRVRATVRDLAREREVRECIASQIDAGDRLELLRADLTEDAGWTDAMAGCDYVLHVASPFPPKQPKDADELIVPAREGTLRVLRAALDAGVKRVVATSSLAAVRNDRGGALHGEREMTEEDWSDPSDPHMTPYAQSKVLAERAAWELVRERGGQQRLTTIQPGAIAGPVLGTDRSYSLRAIERLLDGEMPGLPKLGFAFSDVRDLAALHVKAMTAPAAGGQRLLAAGDFLWFADVARILREHLGPDARKVPTRQVPNFVVRAMALVDPEVRSVSDELGWKVNCSWENARRCTGWAPRPVQETILDCARSLLEQRATAAVAAS
ncbi:MAG: SDR family oxidoreductase [Solirubrobacteraceae bacterium]